MIYLNNVNKQYGEKILFKDASFHLRPREKVGLVGDNGMGKTTLFRLILKQEPLDTGSIAVRKGARVAMLAQDLEPGAESVLEKVALGGSYFQRVKKEMETLEQDTRLHEGDPEGWSRRYGHLQHEFERMGGYEREPKAKTILAGLGFKQKQWEQPLANLSGGWRMRAELARLLLQNPDALLLDEPSNHLDLQSALWLESFLKNYDGAVMLISHDRRFLNEIVGRIVSLDRGVLASYTGDYDDYEKQKAQRETQLEQAAANQQRRISELERFIERFRAKNTKARQAQSRVKMLGRIERVQTATHSKTVNFRFPQPSRFGRIVIDLKNVDKSYGSLSVYQNLSTHLERGWKVALVGENGAGKSTLLKLLAGVVQPQRGEIKLGSNVSRAYYAQHQTETLDSSLTVLETLEDAAPTFSRTRTQTLLGSFRFSGDDVNKKVSVLSGGERSRLALARMLVSPVSLLLLDEPTNHLDMRSLEVLAAALSDYEGTICAISHDRYFLDGFVNRVWEVQTGKIKEYPGNYSDYEWAKSREAETERNAEKRDASGAQDAKKDRSQKRLEAEERNRKYRLLKPLRAKLKNLENRLEQTMKTKSELDQTLADPEIYSDSQKGNLMTALARHEELESQENDILNQMERLSEEIKKAG